MDRTKSDHKAANLVLPQASLVQLVRHNQEQHGPVMVNRLYELEQQLELLMKEVVYHQLYQEVPPQELPRHRTLMGTHPRRHTHWDNKIMTLAPHRSPDST